MNNIQNLSVAAPSAANNIIREPLKTSWGDISKQGAKHTTVRLNP